MTEPIVHPEDTPSFRDTLYTVDRHGRRRWVYPQFSPGRLMRLRTALAGALMAFYLVMPWLTVNGEQAIHLDLPGRRFVLLGSVFWATDTRFLVLILLILALSLFFFTALFGRIWCGWACPETVFLEFLFRPIERWIEGEAAARKRLDESPWTLAKVWRKGLKYLIFAALAWIIASTFLAYFVGAKPLLAMMQGSPLDHLTPFLMTVAMMGVMLFQFGWFREQFCTLVCPYARFQSVLLDTDSLTVGYDARRGEPRGRGRTKGVGRGDCVDCGMCVRVCPTGIDIRNGLQLECVNCAACIDACDSIMAKLGRPQKLIRYDTQRGLAGSRTRWVRPRVLVYTGILAVLLATLVGLLVTRSMTEFQVLRGPADVPFTAAADGTITNHLHARLANKDRVAHLFELSTGEAGAVTFITPLNPFPVAAGGMATVPLFFTFPASALRDGKLEVRVVARSDAGARHEQVVTLLGPG